MSFDYSKDKAKWVNFKSGRKKEKLRHYIADIASRLSTVNQFTIKENRERLIFFYNMDGLPGVNRAAKILVNEKAIKTININDNNNDTGAKP